MVRVIFGAVAQSALKTACPAQARVVNDAPSFMPSAAGRIDHAGRSARSTGHRDAPREVMGIGAPGESDW